MIAFATSPKESARFGLRVGRADMDAFDAAEVAASLERADLDVAILRVPSEMLARVEHLRSFGFAPIVADTLARYEIDLAGYTSSPPDGGVFLREARRKDAALLAAMTREIFFNYVSHYHANPLFATDKILEGYAEWAASLVGPNGDGSAAWLVESGGETIGFSCYRLDANTDLAVGVLNGILPGARRRGHYRAMLQSMLHRFAGMGVSRFAIATQIHNIAVQHTWTTEGLSLRHASNTLHVNLPRKAFVDDGGPIDIDTV